MIEHEGDLQKTPNADHALGDGFNIL